MEKKNKSWRERSTNWLLKCIMNRKALGILQIAFFLGGKLIMEDNCDITFPGI